jgi:small subunit ribosomal protein S8
MVTDPISDMLVQLKNAAMVRKEAVMVPYSNLKHEIAKVLEKHGYVSGVTKRGKKNRKYLYCELTYTSTGAKLGDIKRVSKPSRRIYAGVKELKPIRQGTGYMIISTPQGIMTDKEAREAKVGGEILFKIW